MSVASAIPADSAGVLAIVQDDDLRLQSANYLTGGTWMAEADKIR